MPSLVVKDSMNFLSGSLYKLVEKIKKSKKNSSFPHLYHYFVNNHMKKRKVKHQDFKLLLRKGVFPYNYINNFKVFEETKLPCKEAFYDDLRKEHITDEDYQHAQQIWTAFKIKNLGEYSDLYNETDTILLADVMERFRSSTMKEHNLDPMHYLTLPGWNYYRIIININ